MLKTVYSSYAEVIVSAVMIFSMGCLFGADHPDIPWLVWIVLIFVGACAKVWLHHHMADATNQNKQDPPSGPGAPKGSSQDG